MAIYRNEGVCSQGVEFTIDAEGKLRGVKIYGGCGGNTQGVCKLAEGRDAREIVSILKGIRCGGSRSGMTSCPDQLARAIEQELKEPSIVASR